MNCISSRYMQSTFWSMLKILILFTSLSYTYFDIKLENFIKDQQITGCRGVAIVAI